MVCEWSTSSTPAEERELSIIAECISTNCETRTRGPGSPFFFFQAEDGIRDADVTRVQTCALPIFKRPAERGAVEVAVAEVLLPHVLVAVDVHQRDRAVPARDRTQDRERDRVVPSNARGNGPDRKSVV